MNAEKSEIRDGMQIDWDVPIAMDDGVILRADLFRPPGGGAHPVILSYGPYAKGLSFQEGYKGNWARLTKAAPEVLQGSTNKYQNWELVDPEKWVPDGYACLRIDSRGAGRSPGYLDVWSVREAQDLYQCIEWAGAPPAATRVDAHTGIAVRHPFLRIDQFPVLIFVARARQHLGRGLGQARPVALVAFLERQPLGVGPVAENDRMLPRPRRPEHVGAQDDAVVHGNRRVPIDLHAAGAATRLVHVTPL
jgi:hypothetical protein